MKALFKIAACIVCFASQAIAGESDQMKAPAAAAVESLGAPPIEAAPIAKTTAKPHVMRHDKRCLPLRHVGIAESAEHYYADCELPQSDTHSRMAD
jgi:hypothetical protein